MPERSIPPKSPSIRQLFETALSDRTHGVMLLLGFGSGLPFPLLHGTQSALLTDSKVAIETIGLVGLTGLFYALKFIWAPALDAFDAPWLGRRIGRSKAWLVLAQLAVVLGLVGLAFTDPRVHLAQLIVLSCWTAFAAATQDILVDGWRVKAAPLEQQGTMAAVYALGYRLSFFCSQAGALYIAQFVSWRAAYLAMAAVMSVGLVGSLMSKRVDKEPGERPARTSIFQGDFFAPFIDFWKRFGWVLVPIMLLVTLYRLPDFLTGQMSYPLYLKYFRKDEIATITKVYGVAVGALGAFSGAAAIARLGMMPSLIIGGVAAATSHLCLAWLAAAGHSLGVLTISVSVENFAGSFAGAALAFYMSSLVTPRLASSQYALLSSLFALTGIVLKSFSGFAVKAIGFGPFFIACSSLALPIFLLCLLMRRLQAGLHDPRIDAAPGAADAAPPATTR